MSKLYIRERSTFGKKIGSEFLAVQPNTDSFFVLNETGKCIYQYLNKKRSLAEIVGKIVKIFSIDEKKAELDIHVFLADGIKRGLVKEI